MLATVISHHWPRRKRVDRVGRAATAVALAVLTLLGATWFAFEQPSAAGVRVPAPLPGMSPAKAQVRPDAPLRAHD